MMPHIIGLKWGRSSKGLWMKASESKIRESQDKGAVALMSWLFVLNKSSVINDVAV